LEVSSKAGGSKDLKSREGCQSYSEASVVFELYIKGPSRGTRMGKPLERGKEKKFMLRC